MRMDCYHRNIARQVPQGVLHAAIIAESRT